MNCAEIIKILNCGEDSTRQFKENMSSLDQLAVEISAFANTEGGCLIVGVSDRGDLIGLSKDDIHRLNQWISNAVSQKIDKPLAVTTEILLCDEKRIMLIFVPRGENKPYAVNRVDVWVKVGADKRRASIEEVLRLAQSSGLIFADELETEAALAEFDQEFFTRRYQQYYRETLDESGISFEYLLRNLKLLKQGKLTLAGLLLFGRHAERFRPQFRIKATSFAGTDMTGQTFNDKEEIEGKLIDQFIAAKAFIKRNLRRVQKSKNFNAPGELEIPEDAFSEVIANALVHRSYYINAPILIHLFEDRVEIHSPGSLPNTLTEENIKFGAHIERNPTLLSFLEKDDTFSYTGRGSGIPRVLRLCETNGTGVTFHDDKRSQRFSAVFSRK